MTVPRPTSPNVTVIPVRKTFGNRELTQETKIRVAAYCRVSTDREEQESSYEVQVQHYTDFIKGNPKWEYAGIYADDGLSATNTKKREAFNRMIDDCMDGKIDMIITKSISRFARNTIDCLKYVRQLKEKHIPIVFEKENINTMESRGEIMITIMASLAQQESESLSKNVSLGVQFRYQNGQVMVNHNRFLGYTRLEKNGPLVIVPDQAETVRRIYREYLEGKSTRKIAQGLERDGIRNGAGRTKWHDTNIAQILSNEKYMGDALLQKTYTLDPLEKLRKKNNGEVTQYYVENCHEPIISREVFTRVQQEKARRAAMAASSVERRKQYSSKYALSGIVVCGQCGQNYRRIKWNNRGCRSIVWRCEHRLNDGQDGCSSRTVNEDALKNAVVYAVNRLLLDKDAVMNAFRTSLDECLSTQSDISVSEIDMQLEQLQKELISKALSNEDFAELNSQILDLKERKQKILSDGVRLKQLKERTNRIMEFIESRSDLITEYNDTLVRYFVEKIHVYEDRLSVELKTGDSVDIML